MSEGGIDLYEAILALQELRLRHSFTGAAFDDLLSVIQKVSTCPQLTRLSSRAKFDTELSAASRAREAVEYRACPNAKCSDRVVLPINRESMVCVCGTDLLKHGLRFHYTPVKGLLLLHLRGFKIIT
eukprot:sb/3475461/